MDVRDCTFLISGGGSGLGAGAARMLVQHGANVVVADIDQDAGIHTARELGEPCLFIPTDVTREESVQAAVDGAAQHFGMLNGAICCAGIALAERTVGRRGPHAVRPHRLEPFMQTLLVNLVGTFHVMRLAASAMARNQPSVTGERGVVINTASIAAYEGQVGQLAYAASKGAVAAMTLPAARDLAHFGIRVMTIAPGIFDTPLLAKLPEAARVALTEEIPFPQRPGRPDEFAALVLHIIENTMLNGEVIRLDGALRMGAQQDEHR